MEEGMVWEIQNLVGIIFHTIFQRKSLRRWFSWSFQRPFQLDFERCEGVEGDKELMKWWADLVEKKLVEEGVQRRKSECGRMVVGSNKKCKTFCLQDMVGECIRSEMARGWLEEIDGNLGIGVKDGEEARREVNCYSTRRIKQR